MKLFKISQNGFDMDVSAYLQLVMKNDLSELRDILPPEFSTLYDKNLPELEQELDSIVIYEEVLHVLEDLKKHFRVFLISNLASPYKEPVFYNNLDQYFEKMIFSCDYGFLKPNKEIFKEIEKFTSNKPNEILMVGDSFKSDIVGAKNMGWNYLKISRYTPISKDYEIKNLNEIIKH
ncbi:putative hydrolase of the HAD superfamily [Aquimarina sp. EL_43]|nr:putative hydrolase of the HAD superfamily [Aquimarina sp. EL_35]MBG6149011.1 putative hydrolase of the HAD superfamily [Aquimarina sp. EL_32]MBG6168615.1 putative hydrolase of the HAD superfamily [Aquimarina sp. EL_43]